MHNKSYPFALPFIFQSLVLLVIYIFFIQGSLLSNGWCILLGEKSTSCISFFNISVSVWFGLSQIKNEKRKKAQNPRSCQPTALLSFSFSVLSVTNEYIEGLKGYLLQLSKWKVPSFQAKARLGNSPLPVSFQVCYLTNHSLTSPFTKGITFYSRTMLFCLVSWWQKSGGNTSSPKTVHILHNLKM